MRVAIVGSRDYPFLNHVWQFVTSLARAAPDTIIVSGGARGVDTVGAASARLAGLPVEELLPDWDRHGELAGFERNSRIVESCDRVVAFWDEASNGTRDTISKALAAGKKVLVIGRGSVPIDVSKWGSRTDAPTATAQLQRVDRHG